MWFLLKQFVWAILYLSLRLSELEASIIHWRIHQEAVSRGLRCWTDTGDFWAAEVEDLLVVAVRGLRLLEGLVDLVEQLLAFDSLEKLHVLASVRVQIVKIFYVVNSSLIFWYFNALSWGELISGSQEI